LGNLKARIDEGNDDSDNLLKLIRDAHNVKEKVIHEQHLDRMEDYLEVIYELIKKKGYTTQTDVSESLNISLPSLTKMLCRLDESKYLKYDEDSANIDAEGIEHHLHLQTLKKLREFIRNHSHCHSCHYYYDS
jgi:Mn-dependent DtxR family transcriptional regulator